MEPKSKKKVEKEKSQIKIGAENYCYSNGVTRHQRPSARLHTFDQLPRFCAEPSPLKQTKQMCLLLCYWTGENLTVKIYFDFVLCQNFLTFSLCHCMLCFSLASFVRQKSMKKWQRNQTLLASRRRPFFWMGKQICMYVFFFAYAKLNSFFATLHTFWQFTYVPLHECMYIGVCGDRRREV